MIPDRSFNSAWWKWHWAGIHAIELKECIPGGAKVNQFVIPEVVSQYDPKRHAIVLTIDSDVTFPEDWSLRLGDIVSNFRASLDHLAWAVVGRGDKAGLLCDGPSHFRKSLPGKLPGARRADVTIIRRFQPYQRGKRNLPIHVLRVLNECSNFDKHRALQAVPVRPARTMLTINNLVDCALTRNPGLMKTIAIKKDAEIGRIYVKKTGPDPHAYMNGAVGLEIAIDNKVWLRDWLNETQRFIGCLLAEFSDPPNGVLYIPDDWATGHHDASV